MDYSTVALVIIGLSDFIFLFVYFIVEWVIFGHPHMNGRRIGLSGVAMGVLAAVFVASLLRRASGPKVVSPHRVDPPDGDHSQIL